MRRMLVLAALVFSLPAQAVTIDWVAVGNLRISLIVNTPIGHRERGGARLALGESSGYAEPSVSADASLLKRLFVGLSHRFLVRIKGR